MKRIKSEENHEKTNDVNFQGTALFGKWKKNFHDFRRKEKDVNGNEYVMKVLAFFLNIWSLPIS